MKQKATRGSALLLTTILLFIILSMVVSLTYVTVMEPKMRQKTKSSVGAFYGAESGVEWALNKIATGSGNTISGKFGSQAASATSEGKMDCPFSGCSVYLLGSNGDVIPKSRFSSADSADLVKAVRSVGDQGNETQRAIEAAVAANSGPTSWQCQIVHTGGDLVNCPIGTRLISGGCAIAGTGAANANNPDDNADHTGSWHCNISGAGGGAAPVETFAWCCQ